MFWPFRVRRSHAACDVHQWFKIQSLKNGWSSRCVWDIEASEVAMSFLFFCVKNIMQGEFGITFSGKYTQKRKHLLGNKSPNTSWLQLADFFFRKVDILWSTVGSREALPGWVPLMDREPTMDAMLLCLGGAMKTPPVSWAQGLKSEKTAGQPLLCFSLFLVCFKNGSAFDVFHDSFFGPQFFFFHLSNGIQQGLDFSTKAFHPRGIKDLLRRVSKSACSWTLPGSAWCRGPSALGSALVTACIQGNCCGYGGKESNLWWTARWRLQSLHSMFVAVAWESCWGGTAPCDWCGG